MQKTQPKSLFLWPREMFAPPSLFKHYVYLGEMAGVAKKYSDVDIMDLSLQNISRQEFVSRLSDRDFVFIPVEVYTARSIVNLVEYIRNQTKAKIIGYSTACALNPGLFTNYFDYVVASGFRGNAIKAILQNDFLDFSIDGNIIKTKQKPSNIEWGIAPLNQMPVQEYLKISHNEVELSVQMGCKANCAFCMEKIFHPASFVEYRPIPEIVKFFETNIYDRYFLDATTFTIDKKWVLNLCDAIKTANVPNLPKWRTVTRVDCLDDELCTAMSSVGCYQIGLGIETLSPNVQKNVHKVIQEQKIIQVFDMLKRNNIQPRGFFILGLPGQTKEDVDYCLSFIKDNGIPCRWKEYLPLHNVKTFNDIAQLKPFEKDSFFFHPVANMSKEDYLKVLLKDTRYTRSK